MYDFYRLFTNLYNLLFQFLAAFSVISKCHTKNKNIEFNIYIKLNNFEQYKFYEIRKRKIFI